MTMYFTQDFRIFQIGMSVDTYDKAIYIGFGFWLIEVWF